MSYIVESRVKKYIKGKGKRMSKSFYHFLNRKVVEIIDRQIGVMGSRKTLMGDDAEALETFAGSFHK